MNTTTMTWSVQKFQSKNAISGPAATVWPVRPWPYRFFEEEKWRRLDSNLTYAL